jgi:hypothetical protein
MTRWILRQLNRLPQPWRFITACVVALALLGTVVFLFSQIRACGYNKAKTEYEAQDKKNAEESARLKGRAEAAEQRAADAESKLLAYEKLAEDKKRLDDSITDKIDQVIEEGAHEEAITDAPTDCWTRADRTCAKFGQLKPPIALDCDAYKRKLCAPR